jgi:hypothetical protein
MASHLLLTTYHLPLTTYYVLRTTYYLLLQVGLGIHGEPGAAVAPLASADEVVDHLLATIMSQVRG